MWFVYWDPCGLACYAFGELTILLINYVTVFEVMVPWLLRRNPLAFFLHLLWFESVVFVVFWAHWKAAGTEPGLTRPNTAVIERPEDLQPQRRGPGGIPLMKRHYCSRCSAFKPPRAHHCSLCGRCVMKMDHHCPWVNNCVGKNSYKYFLLFVFWVFVGCTYAAVMMSLYAATCMNEWGGLRCAKPSTEMLILDVVTLVLAVFFAIFVCAMMCDQYEALVTDTTGIEAMKRWVERDWTLAEGLEEVMGMPFGWQWFIPVTPPRKALYIWSPRDDPDEYDERDPRWLEHVQKVEQDLLEQQRQAQLQAAEQRAGGSTNATTGKQQLTLAPQGSQEPGQVFVGPDGAEYVYVREGQEGEFSRDEWTTDEEADEDVVEAPGADGLRQRAAASPGQEEDDEDVARVLREGCKRPTPQA